MEFVGLHHSIGDIGDDAVTIFDYVAIGLLAICLMLWAGTALLAQVMIGAVQGRMPPNANPSLQTARSEIVATLLKIDGLIMPGFIELCTPHFVHPLVVGPAEDHGRAEPNVEVAQIFQSPD